MHQPIFEEIFQRANIAIEILFLNDIFLLTNSVHERSICHKFAEYLQILFPDWDVDCEYNKKGNATKRLMNIPNCSTKITDNNEHSVYPDIIIHQRNLTDNLLVIEVKTSNKNNICDIEKLIEFTTNPDFKYSYGLFVRFKGIQKPDFIKFKNGEEFT